MARVRVELALIPCLEWWNRTENLLVYSVGYFFRLHPSWYIYVQESYIRKLIIKDYYYKSTYKVGTNIAILTNPNILVKL